MYKILGPLQIDREKMLNHHIASKLPYVDQYVSAGSKNLLRVCGCVCVYGRGCCIDWIQYVVTISCFHLFDVMEVYGFIIDKRGVDSDTTGCSGQTQVGLKKGNCSFIIQILQCHIILCIYSTKHILIGLKSKIKVLQVLIIQQSEVCTIYLKQIHAVYLPSILAFTDLKLLYQWKNKLNVIDVAACHAE